LPNYSVVTCEKKILLTKNSVSFPHNKTEDDLIKSKAFLENKNVVKTYKNAISFMVFVNRRNS
tara:strand:+ start:536 stop:724 length:189 start_codon:yes stop_codon:yes gene_type:complete